jgi:hypothetical protein
MFMLDQPLHSIDTLECVRHRVLARVLEQVFDETRNIGSLEACIDLQRTAFHSYHLTHASRECTQWELLDSLNKYYEDVDTTSMIANLQHAVAFAREGYARTTKDDVDRWRSCGLLAALLHRCRDDSTTEEVISLQRECMSLCLTHGASVDQAVSCHRLATSLSHMFDRNSRMPYLLEAIALERHALSMHAPQGEGRGGSCVSLAGCLVRVCIHTGDINALNEGTDLFRESLQLCPPGSPHRARACTGLAVALQTRADHTGDDSLLDEIIGLEREVIYLRVANAESRAMIRDNLASSLCDLFARTEVFSLLDEAEALFESALSIPGLSDTQRSGLYYNLTRCVVMRNEGYTVEDNSWIDRVGGLLRSSPELLPIENAQYANLCVTLAFYLELRSKDSDRIVPLLTEAEEMLQKAESILPPGHVFRWKVTIMRAHLHVNPSSPSYNVENAITCINEVMSPPVQAPSALLSEVDGLLQLISSSDLSSRLEKMLVDTYSTAIDLVVVLAGFLLDQETQLHCLKSCASLGPSACLIAIRADQRVRGIQLLERARGVVWSQLLRLKQPHTDDDTHALSGELVGLMQSVHQGKAEAMEMKGASRGQKATKDMVHKQHARIQEIIREIRSTPGLEDFMQGLSDEELMSTSESHTVVVLLSHGAVCQAIVLRSPRDRPTTLLLDSITANDLQNGLIMASLSTKRGALYDEMEDDRGMRISRRLGGYHALLAKLWKSVVKPILAHLELQVSPPAIPSEDKTDAPTQPAEEDARPRIYWCPTGAFAFAPLHAAGIYEQSRPECCADYVVSSYTPTLSALRRAQTSAKTLRVRGSQFLPIAAPRAAEPSLPVLRYVHREIEIAGDLADDAHVIRNASAAESATRAQAIAALTSANIVHIAYHGIQDTAHPLNSSFHLNDGSLSIHDLMQIDLKDAFLAFLSACETAKGDKEQPDQTVHLAATMLFVGFKSVVATMWHVLHLGHLFSEG